MFVWNKDRTFYIRYKEIKEFFITREDDLYCINALRYEDKFPLDMGHFDTKEEAIKAINDFVSIIKRRE